MFMKKMIAVTAFLLFAAIGLAGNPVPADAQEEPHMTIAPIAFDPDAVCDTAPEIQSFEASGESKSNDCQLDCWEKYQGCLEFLPPSRCLPGYHNCINQC
jgi:hypothetical protein